jgi:hypothetical protein
MSQTPDALDRVNDELKRLAEALESGQPDRVLAVEQPLAEAASALADVGRVALGDEVRLRARLLETRLALDRCRSLGDASADLIGAMWPSETSYSRKGARSAPATGRPSVTTRA